MAESVVQMFIETVHKRPDAPAARFKAKSGEWTSRSWAQMSEDRKVIAAGLIALGLHPDQRANIISNSSYRWMLVDLAIQSAGATTVAIYPSNLADEIEYIINDCGGSMVIAEDRAQLNKLLAVRPKLEKVTKVVLMNDDTDGAPADWVIGWSAFERLGKERLKELEPEIERRIQKLSRDAVLCLIYTSGTTGKPKGVVLTHANLLYEVEACLKIDLIRPDDLQLFFLPLAHSFGKVLQCIWFGTGHEMAIDHDIPSIVGNMAVVRPTVMCSVPRIFEKVYARVTGNGLEQPGLKGKLFRWALDVSDRVAQLKIENKAVPSALQLQLNLARSLVFSKVEARLKDLFGGRLRYFISGGAPLSKRMAYFFDNAGVLILEGFGLTETSAATTVNRMGKNKIGTVGSPVPGTELKIADDGEIMIKGPGVMREYWGKPEATREVISPDGWFSTGDIGTIDEDGYLRITDRKKDIIVTAGGKNVAPQNLESLVKATSPLISQTAVFGDRRKHLVALVTIDPDNVKKVPGVPAGEYTAQATSPAVKQAVEAVFNIVNAQLPAYETIKKFQILERDFEIGDELTPSMKVKRKHVLSKYKSIIDELYEDYVD